MQNQDAVANFDSLLEWLDPDRERAAEKYQGIRHSLIKIFSWRATTDAEFLADETLERVMSRVSELRHTYKGDPSLYVYGVAKKVLIEQRHGHVRNVELPDAVPESQTTAIDDDRSYDCMDRCLAKLSPSSRALILDYYSREDTEKVLHRKELAESLQITPQALRVRAYRIRSELQRCIEACMKQKDES